MSTKSERLYKFTKVMIIIFLFPSIIAGLFSSFVLISTKSNGGVPSFFNLRVIEISNNDFHNANSGKFMAGEHCPFSNVNEQAYRPGDVIAFYEYSEQNGNTKIIKNWNFEDDEFSGEAMSFATTSSNLSNTLVAKKAQNASENIKTLSFVSQNPDNKPNILLGKIARIGIAFDEGNVEYICFSLYSSATDTVDEDLILAIDVVGKSTELSNFFIDVIVFCSTAFSLFVLLIPCVLLIIFNIINITAKKMTEKEEHQEAKRILIKQSKQLESPAVPQQPNVVVKRENAEGTDLAKALERESRQDILKMIKEDEIKKRELNLKNEKDFYD